MKTYASGQTAVLSFLWHNFITLHEGSKTSGYITDSEYVDLYKKVMALLLLFIYLNYKWLFSR
jgi:hypothetical protein